jgi:hypothetical protein
MVKAFDIDRIGKAAAVFDKKKLLWMNGQYIRKLDLDTLVTLVEPYVPEFVRQRYDAATRREIASILQDSIDTLADFATRASIFEPNVVYEEEAKALLQTDSARRVVAGMVERLREHEGALTPESFKAMILATGQKPVEREGLYFDSRRDDVRTARPHARAREKTRYRCWRRRFDEAHSSCDRRRRARYDALRRTRHLALPRSPGRRAEGLVVDLTSGMAFPKLRPG